MIDRSPMLNGMSVKQRAKHYDALASGGTTGITDTTKKRGKSYVGQPLAKQSADHKAPTMTPRAESYSPSNIVDQYGFYAVNNIFSLKLGTNAGADKGTATGGIEIKCSKISNLSLEQSVEEIPEGGNNEYPNIFISQGKKRDVLVIEKAFVKGDNASKLKPGVFVGGGIITIGKGKEKKSSAEADKEGIYKTLSFSDGMITKVEFSNLDAMGNEIMIQKLEISHTGFTQS